MITSAAVSLLLALPVPQVPVQKLSNETVRQPLPKVLEVLSVSPAPNALDVPRTTSVSFTFNAPVSVASLGPAGFSVWGRWSSLTPGTITTSSGGRVVTFTPAGPFSAAEWVTVSLSRNVRDGSGAHLARPVSWGFWVDSRPGEGTFSLKDTLVPGQTPYGAHGGDIDEDGDLDLCIPNEDSSDVSVFLNSGGGSFTGPVSYGVGFHGSPNEAADLDHDGRLDLVVANILDHDVSVLRGVGDGTFLPQTSYAAATQPRGLALIDYDGDGFMDAVTACRLGDTLALLHNLGDGTFAPPVLREAMVLGETGVTACDMNNDLVTDLVVAGYNGSAASVLLGDGSGSFHVHATTAVPSFPWMVVAGDVNADGFNDAVFAMAGTGAVAVALNDGTGALLPPTSYPTGSFTIAVDLGDLDGDGDLDVTGSSFSGGTFRAYYNDGNGNFGGGFTLQATQAGSCTVLHDFDGDGDVDITGIDEAADRVFLFEQDG